MMNAVHLMRLELSGVQVLYAHIRGSAGAIDGRILAVRPLSCFAYRRSRLVRIRAKPASSLGQHPDRALDEIHVPNEAAVTRTSCSTSKRNRRRVWSANFTHPNRTCWCFMRPKLCQAPVARLSSSATFPKCWCLSLNRVPRATCTAPSGT